ncbi:MAG: hypothetical protein R8P61_07275 [Bacteroidia bacterium]|nr:hypothetical protein [Bacteroidia bacterium]
MLKKILIWTAAILLLFLGVFVISLLSPSLFYSHAQAYGQIRILHNQALEEGWENQIDTALQAIESSVLYDPNFQIELCLQDGSSYPQFVELVFGEAFAFGFASKAVLNMPVQPESGYIEKNGKRRDLAELLAHEFIHNFQYQKYGFATLNFPFWKLEGYAEYMMRMEKDDLDLRYAISHLLKYEEKGSYNYDWVEWENEIGTPHIYLKSNIMVQYLMEIEGLTYDEIVKDQRSTEAVFEEVLAWYEKNPMPALFP